MYIFKRRLRYYLEKYFAFQTTCGEGDAMFSMLWDKVKTMITYGGILSTGAAGAEVLGVEVFNYLPSWLGWVKEFVYTYLKIFIPLFLFSPLIELVKDYFLGRFSKRIGYWQLKLEWLQRKGLDPWEAEKMDRIKSIEAKVSPETRYDKNRYKTYMEKK